jgi:hypothetical protein
MTNTPEYKKKFDLAIIGQYSQQTIERKKKKKEKKEKRKKKWTIQTP